MKYAPWVAGAALGVIVLTLSTAKAIDPPDKITALDVSGIDTLEVHSNRAVEITIRSDVPARAKYGDSTKSKVGVRRQGSRLIVDAHLEGGYEDLDLSVPASIHRLVLDGGTVHTKEKLASMELLVSGDVGWNGDVGTLVMRDTKDRKRSGKCECGSATDFNVHGGFIREAWFYSPDGRLKLEASDHIDSVHAWLGPKGDVSLDGARRFDQIHLVETEGEMPAIGVQVAAPP